MGCAESKDHDAAREAFPPPSPGSRRRRHSMAMADVADDSSTTMCAVRGTAAPGGATDSERPFNCLQHHTRHRPTPLTAPLPNQAGSDLPAIDSAPSRHRTATAPLTTRLTAASLSVASSNPQAVESPYRYDGGGGGIDQSRWDGCTITSHHDDGAPTAKQLQFPDHLEEPFAASARTCEQQSGTEQRALPVPDLDLSADELFVLVVAEKSARGDFDAEPTAGEN